MAANETLVLGGGVIGLSLALELQQQGRQVTLLERDRICNTSHGAATTASAGILGVHDPNILPQLRELAEFSYGLYPDFLRRLQEFGGVEVAMQTRDVLEAVKLGSPALPEKWNRLLTKQELVELEPELEPGNAPWYLREEPSLDPRQLCAALVAACRAAGVDLRENEPALEISPALAGMMVRTETGTHHAANVVIAAGAWSAQLSNNAITTEPRRGQMLALESAGHAIRHVIRAPGVYLVPRGDRLILGSTVERAGFEVATQPAAMKLLHAAAAQVFPGLAGVKRVDQWAGLRPGTPDDLPILGPLRQEGAFPSMPRIFAATGHFRNGILLAPGTARVMAQVLQGRTPEVSLAAFSPSRQFQV